MAAATPSTMSRLLFRGTLTRHCRVMARGPRPVMPRSSTCGRMSTFSSPRLARVSLLGLIGSVSVGGASLWALYLYIRRRGLFQAALPLLSAKEEGKEVKPTRKERRFKDFASCSYHGEPYMTARDFLESVTLVRPRVFRIRYLDDATVAKMLKSTPPRSKNCRHLFRNLWDNAVISYGDYLFLLSILTKPTSQFEIAFKLIDRDGSDFIDKQEFQQMQDSVTTKRPLPWLQQSALKETSLVRHLFGARGTDRLYSKDFFGFIQNFQTEVREIEFSHYAKGLPTISEEDFASILLKHTRARMSAVVERLRERATPDSKGIAFNQFNLFCQLLDNLDDFSTALAIHNLSGLPVTKDEFGRAAYICLDTPLDPVIVNAVFNIFDVDGDGKLSYKEFILVMKSWSERASLLREAKKEGPWQQFKACVHAEMKES